MFELSLQFLSYGLEDDLADAGSQSMSNFSTYSDFLLDIFLQTLRFLEAHHGEHYLIFERVPFIYMQLMSGCEFTQSFLDICRCDGVLDDPRKLFETLRELFLKCVLVRIHIGYA